MKIEIENAKAEFELLDFEKRKERGNELQELATLLAGIQAAEFTERELEILRGVGCCYRSNSECRQILELVERFPAITKGEAFRGTRVTEEEIDAIQETGLLPTVQTQCGATWLVDFCGLVHPGRQAKPRFQKFDADIQTAKTFFRFAICEDANLKVATFDSYQLKHTFQRLFGYVCNGALIVAAHSSGFPLVFKGSLNAGVRIRRKFVNMVERCNEQFNPYEPLLITAKTGRLLKKLEASLFDQESI